TKCVGPIRTPLQRSKPETPLCTWRWIAPPTIVRLSSVPPTIPNADETTQSAASRAKTSVTRSRILERYGRSPSCGSYPLFGDRAKNPLLQVRLDESQCVDRVDSRRVAAAVQLRAAVRVRGDRAQRARPRPA